MVPPVLRYLFQLGVQRLEADRELFLPQRGLSVKVSALNNNDKLVKETEKNNTAAPHGLEKNRGEFFSSASGKTKRGAETQPSDGCEHKVLQEKQSSKYLLQAGGEVLNLVLVLFLALVGLIARKR